MTWQFTSANGTRRVLAPARRVAAGQVRVAEDAGRREANMFSPRYGLVFVLSQQL
jgi:hypothetical protein